MERIMNKAVTTHTVATPVNVTALVASLDGYGRTYTNVRNVVIARALDSGVSQKTIVEESKLDKGTVSRISSALKGLAPARLKVLRSFDLKVIESNATDAGHAILAAAAKFGADNLVRKTKTKVPADKSEAQPDALAGLVEWLSEAADRKTWNARVALVNDNIARMQAERDADGFTWSSESVASDVA